MAFRFSLEAVLRLRQSLEQQQELRLREANQQVSALARQVHDVDLQLTRGATRERQRLESGVSAAEIKFEQQCLSVLQEHRSRLEQRRDEAIRARDVCAAAYRKARQQREVLETFRNQQLQAHRQEMDRHNQRSHDDLLLLRRAFLQRR